MNAKPVDSMQALLDSYVTPQGVDYARLKKDRALPHVLTQMSATKTPANGPAALAYWLNVYNFYTLKVIVENYPLDSITDLHLFGSVVLGHIFNQTVWKTWHFKLAGQDYTLDQVEHAIIRPRFNDFRAHAAMVCAAQSCPPLRAQAYHAKALDRQLDDQMRIWLADTSKNRYDTKTRTLYLSAIFNWFKDDFTDHGKRDLVRTLLPFFPPNTAARIRQDQKEIKLQYLEYDWSLNAWPQAQL